MTNICTPPRNRQELPHHEASRPTWLELFYDLVFVAVFIQVGDLLSSDVTWLGAGKVVVLFAPLWWVWANFVWYMNQFHVDDVWHRFILIVQIFLVAWMGITVTGAFGDSSTEFVLCYIGFRLTMILMYIRSFKHMPEARSLMIFYIRNYHFVGAVCWGGSLLLPPDQRWMVWVGVFIWELRNSFSKTLSNYLEKFPVHLGHLAERYGTLIILVLGESFIKSITVDPAPAFSLENILFTFPGTILLFSLWWIYFDDAHDEEPEVNEDSFLSRDSAVLWLYTHLPLSLVLISFGVAITKLVGEIGAEYLKPEYATLFLGSLALFCILLTFITQKDEKSCIYWRLGSALLLLLMIPAVILWKWTATITILFSVLIFGAQVIREVLATKKETVADI